MIHTERFAAHGLAPEGRPAFGLYLLIASVDVAHLLTVLKADGLDFIVADAQHRPFNPETLAAVARVAADNEMPCLVRVPANDLALAEHVLDYGVSGIVFPVVNGVEDAAAAAAACRFPPEGVRSIGGIPSMVLGASRPDPLCIVQIERAEAAPLAAEILAMPGVDAVMPGPVDTAASMGLMRDYGSIAEAVGATKDIIRGIERAADDAGVGWFRYVPSIAAAGEAAGDGCPLILLGNDADLLLTAGRQMLAEAHAAADAAGAP